jgi:hypothetical protein
MLGFLRETSNDMSVAVLLALTVSDMHRLARHRWQTRQNPRTFPHSGRELRCFGLIRP